MAVLGVDDTDSRTGGMCTTWIGTEIARRLPTGVDVEFYLIRLHPAVAHKTRGNGAVGLRTDVAIDELTAIAEDVIETFAIREDPETNPGLVVVPNAVASRDDLRAFARSAVRSEVTRERARALLPDDAYAREWGNGRGRIGATAAIGAIGARMAGPTRDRPFDDWTYERIVYRERERWGTPRRVEMPNESIDDGGVWDTIDPASGEAVCVPRSPCPVLYGIRGDRRGAVSAVADALGGEPAARARTFLTNQGTDAHLRPGAIGALEEGHSYRVRARVVEPPSTREGGHVHVPLASDGGRCTAVAFAPTGRFRTHVRQLRPGDELIVCGEFDRGSIKLEKFALVDRALTTETTPTCPECDRTMKSAGRGQGYRCKRCGTGASRRDRTPLDRELSRGWYEVPPDARRHLAKPLIRGGYEFSIHPTTGPSELVDVRPDRADVLP